MASTHPNDYQLNDFTETTIQVILIEKASISTLLRHIYTYVYWDTCLRVAYTFPTIHVKLAYGHT